MATRRRKFKLTGRVKKNENSVHHMADIWQHGELSLVGVKKGIIILKIFNCSSLGMEHVSLIMHG